MEGQSELDIEASLRRVTMRFLSLRREPIIDAVAQHRQWQDRLDKERFFDKVFHTDPVAE